jgi:Ca2+-binding RTX toxin-like protein
MDVHGTLNDDPRDDAPGMSIRESEDVSVTNSEFQQLRIGIGHTDGNNIVISNNYFHDLRSDGIAGGGSSNIAITNNYFTEFYSVEGDHADAIQFYTSNGIKVASNITISGNVISQGGSEEFQGIFMRNQAEGGQFLDVVISDNLILGGNYNGIAISEANGVEVTGNTVSSRLGEISWISITHSQNAVATGNNAVHFSFDAESQVQASNNKLNITTTDEGGAVLRDWLETHGGVPGLEAPPLALAKGAAQTAAQASSPDAVTTSQSFALGATAQKLTLTGSADLDGAGNALGNHIIGNRGANRLHGYEGNDTLEGGAGDDTLNGGAGIDTASYESAEAGVVVGLVRHTGEASDGAAQKTGGAGKDVLNSIENLIGSKFGDTLSGGLGDNVIIGGGGGDRLLGSTGADTLVGGSGADTFVAGALSDSTVALSGRDVIFDFSRIDGDRIELKKIDAVEGGADDKFRLVDVFTKAAGQLTVGVEGDHQIVQGDVNGDGVADFAISVYALSKLQAADFLL